MLTASLAGANPEPDLGDPLGSDRDAGPLPFREIGATLGDRALHHNIFTFSGALLFDANGDGRLDLYLPHSGRPVAKATSPDHILTNEPVPALPNTLFLNQGNDEAGNPALTSVQDLIAGGNTERLREELLIEDKYEPRQSLEDDELAIGRIGMGAVAADFNGDGRLDLYVLNTHHGIPFQTPETALRTYPSRNNVGRQDRADREILAITVPPFLEGPRLDGLYEKVGAQSEPEGRNSLFLNRGDRDGDGIPEWEDATAAAGVGGHWASSSASVADIDRDGDLDLYVANFLDPDFWGFGMMTFAGNRNQLYLNQLVETGELTFRDTAAEMGVAGAHGAESLPSGAWFPAEGRVFPSSSQTVDGKPIGEGADHSWATQLVDWNEDGWPDLLVGNDISNRLRVYVNERGERFRRLTEFDDPKWDGCWMGIGSGDLDGDLSDEVLVTSCGSQTLVARNTALFIEDGEEASINAVSVISYPQGKSTMHHALLSRSPSGGLDDVSGEVTLRYSPELPPDILERSNVMPEYAGFTYDDVRAQSTLRGVEFSWGPAILDVDNDRDLDLYFAGALSRGNDNFLGDWSGNPGRLLVNASKPGSLAFEDRTLEYRLLDIRFLDYEAQPLSRPAPGTNWHKRDEIFLGDTDGYSEVGLDAAKSSIRDLYRMHESASGIVSGDLNGDGFADLVVTHVGGYNSTAPTATNLKARFEGRTMAIPAPNQLLKPPTQFEPGHTSVYINGGRPSGADAHWVRLRLLDPGSANRYGVGARVTLNGAIARSVTIGGPTWSAYSGDLLVGLGADDLRTLDIHWPSGSESIERVRFESPARDGLVCIQRSVGVVECPEAAPELTSRKSEREPTTAEAAR